MEILATISSFVTHVKVEKGLSPNTVEAYHRDLVKFEAFAKKLEDAGIKFDSPYKKSEPMNAAFAVFQDPFGTLIELSEGLSAVK